ncbi:hypothetical protein Trydic_g6892 [Trypoxylus dichotomus]
MIGASLRRRLAGRPYVPNTAPKLERTAEKNLSTAIQIEELQEASTHMHRHVGIQVYMRFRPDPIARHNRLRNARLCVDIFQRLSLK